MKLFTNQMLSSTLLVILFTFYQPNQGFLLDYPIKSPKGSLSIFATLTDKSTQSTWSVKETLIVTPKVHGRIEITRGNDKIQVFYHENDDETRLVFYENQCYELKYTSNGWSEMIPTISNPLLNVALLLGPSFYLRIVDQTDSFIADNNVYLRGETMKNLFVHINKDLRVSFIFPASLSSYIGTRQPKRLILTGRVPESSVTHSVSETLLYDIYYETKIPESFGQSLATPTLGIGCPRYLESNQPFPGPTAKRYNVKVIETIEALTKPIEIIHHEFSIDSRNKISRVKIRDHQYGSDDSEQLIVVYNLGIKYILSPTVGTCYVVPMDTDDDPSMDDNLIKINPITLDIKDFKYVGQVSYEHRSGLVDVWESTEYNVTIRDTIYGKIVTTQFMAKQTNYTDNLGSDYLPVAGERKFYKLHLEKFILSESRKRDIYDYDTVNYDEADYRQSFKLTDCYDSPDDKMYLTLQIASSDLNYKQSAENAAGNLYSLRETIKQIVAANLNLSYLRITAIDIEFESIYIVVRLEIVEAPDLLRAVDKQEIKFTRQSFDNYFKVSIRDPIDCLKAQATSNVKFVISCMGLDSLCVGVKEGQPMPESDNSGSYCIVYNNQNGQLRRLVKEVTLEQLTKQFTKLNGIKFNLICSDCPVKSSLLIVNVFQDSPSLDTKETRMLFNEVEPGSKLNQAQNELVTGVRNFGDCYRACASKSSTCETFSFCSSVIGDKYECLISTNTYGSFVDGGTITDSSCSVYGKNNLLDYHKEPLVKFIDVGRSQGLSVQTADECARACVQSKEECYSFQICDFRYCSFGGHFSSSNTISDDFCDIYVPKKIQNFVKKNHQMVASVIHTEVGLTLDQCASMCSAMRQPDDQNQDCKSFNFCPKGEATSLCQLSSVNISSSSENQISTSDDCSNYEYIEETVKQSSQKQQQKQSAQQSTPGIGIIVFFVIIGMVMGLATPWAHNRLKKRFKPYIDERLAKTVRYDNMNDSTTI